MNEEIYQELTSALRYRDLVGVATVLAGPGIGNKLLLWPDDRRLGSLGHESLNGAAIEHAKVAFETQKSVRFHCVVEDTAYDLFLEIHAPPPKLIIVGAVHIAIPLVTFANTLGFETQVLDARSAFATEERFHHADQLLIGWPADTLRESRPDEATYLVFLTHDEKIDNPALAVALESNARYIGALGSRRTHAKRMEALLEMGVSAEALERIHAPIGLNIGARRPEEIAVSIIAEIVQAMNQ